MEGSQDDTERCITAVSQGKYKELILSHRGIAELSPRLFELGAALTRLYLADNCLTQLPASISALTGLVLLDVSGNKLEQLPAGVGKLKQLRWLHASRNELRALPAEIGDCTALRVLDLNSNKLASFPEQLGSLENLEVFKASQNPATGMPAGFLKLQKVKRVEVDFELVGDFLKVYSKRGYKLKSDAKKPAAGKKK